MKEQGMMDLARPLGPVTGGHDFFLAGAREGGEKIRGNEAEIVVVMAGSQYMGKGDDELGGRLAAVFFDAMAAAGRPPAVMTFYNTGVFLTTREGPVLGALKELAAQGSAIISSGVCLDFFNSKDKVKVGRIGNMYEIINAQRAADRIIRL